MFLEVTSFHASIWELIKQVADFIEQKMDGQTDEWLDGIVLFIYTVNLQYCINCYSHLTLNMIWWGDKDWRIGTDEGGRRRGLF